MQERSDAPDLEAEYDRIESEIDDISTKIRTCDKDDKHESCRMLLSKRQVLVARLHDIREKMKKNKAR